MKKIHISSSKCILSRITRNMSNPSTVVIISTGFITDYFQELADTTLATIRFEVDEVVDKQNCTEIYHDMLFTLPSEVFD